MSKQSAFIQSISRGAVEGWRKYKVLPSLTMAQAIVESGWGRSGLTAKSNNLFGIKAGGSWKGAVCEYPTKEYVNGVYISVTGKFRAYPSLDASMEDHGAFLAKLPQYRKVIGETDYRKACEAVKAGGYATAPDYVETLVNCIERYKLYEYDSGLFAFTAKVSGGDFDRLKELCDELSLCTKWEAWRE